MQPYLLVSRRYSDIFSRDDIMSSKGHVPSPGDRVDENRPKTRYENGVLSDAQVS